MEATFHESDDRNQIPHRSVHPPFSRSASWVMCMDLIDAWALSPITDSTFSIVISKDSTFTHFTAKPKLGSIFISFLPHVKGSVIPDLRKAFHTVIYEVFSQTSSTTELVIEISLCFGHKCLTGNDFLESTV